MTSSTTHRVLACLAALVLCVGIVAGGVGAVVDSDLTDEVDEETTDDLAGGTADDSDTDDRTTDDGDTSDEDGEYETDSDLETTVSETTETVDDVEKTVDETAEETTDETAETVDDTTDTVDETTTDTTETVDDTTDETTDTIDETTETITETVDETTDPALSSSIDANTHLDSLEGEETDSLVPGIELNATAGTGLTGVELDTTQVSNERDSDRSNDTAGSDSDSDAEGTGSSAPVDAALVGLMGALTAAGGAGAAGAGAGAGTAGGAAGASTASTMLTNASIRTKWLRQLLTTRLTDIPWELATIFRYSRYDDSDPFENDKRRTIFETIEDDPGSYLSAVSDESDIPLSTVRHHVRILEDEAMLTSVKIRGKRRYFPADEPDVELHAALAEPATRRVLETLADSGSATNGRLAEELECDPSTVSHHLSRLEADDLVTRERDGRSVVTELAPAAETALLEDDISGSGATVQAPADD